MRIFLNQYKRPMIDTGDKEPQLVPAHVETGESMQGFGTAHPTLKPFTRKVPDQVWLRGIPHDVVRGTCPDIVDVKPDDVAEIERIREELKHLNSELDYAIERAHARGTPYRIVKEQKQIS